MFLQASHHLNAVVYIGVSTHRNHSDDSNDDDADVVFV